MAAEGIFLDDPTRAFASGSVFLALVVLAGAVGLAVLAFRKNRGHASDALGQLAPVAPGAVPILNHTHLILWHAKRAHDWLDGLCQAFGGKSFRIVMIGGVSVTMLNSPELFEDVLKTQFETFDKGPQMRENLSGLLGSGIFAVDGVKWLHQRKTASNLFTLRTLRDSMAHTVRELMPTMDRLLQRAVATRAPVDLFKLLNRFTMEAFAKIGFGVDLDCLDADADHPFMEAFDAAQRMVTLRFVGPPLAWKLQRWLNVGNERELRAHAKVIDDTVLDIISRSLERRHQQGTARHGASATSSSSSTTQQQPGVGGPAQIKDIVSLFLDDVSHDGKRGDGEPFDPVFLRDIVVNFLIAGRDTTAQALSWLFYELGRSPHVEARVRAELRLALPVMFEANASSPPPPTMDQVQKLPYLEAALRETLRLHPSVPINFKAAGKDTIMSDGTFIRKDSAVCISSYCLGRAKHVWGPDASEFRPERWIDPQHSDKLIAVSAFQFPAFHAGPRMCLGMNLAMMEMKILVASVLSKFHLAVEPGHPEGYDLSLTLPMKGQFLARVEPVRG